jgi:putative Mn2+ efflux pump MntP
MDFFTLILLALGLSADAFAVAVINGMCDSRVTKKHALLTAFTFGFFQALMPTLGFFLGRSFYEFIRRYQHWVALLLLGAIGINMLIDTYKEWKCPGGETCEIHDVFSAKNLVLQGIATSIDALAAGVSIAVLSVNILYAATVIGSITILCCVIGVFLGKRFGSLLGLKAKLLGGFVILGIGIKIFVENQFL